MIKTNIGSDLKHRFVKYLIAKRDKHKNHNNLTHKIEVLFNNLIKITKNVLLKLINTFKITSRLKKIDKLLQSTKNYAQ